MQTVMLWSKMWTEFQRRLPTYLLVGGSGLNVVHACNPFFVFFVLFLFLFFLIEKNEYKTCLPVVRTKWGFQSWSWILNVLPRGPRIWILDVLRRGPIDLKFRRASQRSKDWNFGRASQRSIEIEFWTCFPEVQVFEVWMCFPEAQWICGRWYLCQCVRILYPSSCKINIFN